MGRVQHQMKKISPLQIHRKALENNTQINGIQNSTLLRLTVLRSVLDRQQWSASSALKAT
jgi:hypothetical protein